MVPRSIVVHVTGFLWRFQLFRVGCIACISRGWFLRAIGLYTPFWWASRISFSADGEHQDLNLALRAGEFERHYERLARVAGL